ncbi:MAG: hypothetical protein A2286_11080 [Gammaproteobacteria bacterium RIFOXYA12_FULL_61_12]|nr:MAG: hypothetical protein A2514_09910 [Gammaproteobacteria bacterium RIFOXYD12_FULL_61_37]OGT92832.1 MAG: hypothetical protein A2286_11080 [Gammaproteobacteria bacterium RIFOXYA12_FULL_61_12]
MRTFILGICIAALMLGTPALAGGPLQLPGATRLHSLKRLLHRLSAPHKPKPPRKAAAPASAAPPPTDGKAAAGTAPPPASPQNTAVPGKVEEPKAATQGAAPGKPLPSDKKAAKNGAKTQSTGTPPPPTAAPATAAASPTRTENAEEAALTEGPAKQRPKAVVTSLKPQDLAEFDRQPKRIREIISAALEMTGMELYYAYGSNNPKNGGMDCSGTIQYLLKTQGFRDTPRQADLIFSWSKQEGTLIPANVHRTDAPELKDLRPGDLLFWSGTYNINRSISHVMMYLGTEKKTRLPVMFGASSGRTYHGESRHGVSVFDFKLPRPEGKSRFEGYGPIPGMFTGEAARTPKS